MRCSWFGSLVIVGGLLCGSVAAEERRAVMIEPPSLDDQLAMSLVRADYNRVVLLLSETAATDQSDVRRAVEVARRNGLACDYWIEVARCETLARSHPELMASLQGHPEWRRFFPKSLEPREDEVVKTYPWVPVLTREGFDVQAARVTQRLKGLPLADSLFLNDLQGAPSACGCGHPLCRWTTDYGTKRSTAAAGPDAAARFCDEVARRTGQRNVIPVWTTECEAHDKQTLCAGVACFEGLCWKEFTKQLTPIAQRGGPVGLLVPFRAFDRDLPSYGARAGWVREACELMQTQPTKHKGTPVSPERLIAVLQGWDVTHREVMAQIAQARQAGAGGFIVSRVPLEQGWEPRIVRWK